jgi:hypothetical protein
LPAVAMWMPNLQPLALPHANVISLLMVMLGRAVVRASERVD